MFFDKTVHIERNENKNWNYVRVQKCNQDGPLNHFPPSIWIRVPGPRFFVISLILFNPGELISVVNVVHEVRDYVNKIMLKEAPAQQKLCVTHTIVT